MKYFIKYYVHNYSLSTLLVYLLNKKYKVIKKIRNIISFYLFAWFLFYILALIFNWRNIFVLLTTIYGFFDLSFALLQNTFFPKEEMIYRTRAFLMIFVHYFQYIIIFSVLYLNLGDYSISVKNKYINAFNAIYLSGVSITSMGSNINIENAMVKILMLFESIIGILFIAVFIYNSIYVFYGFKEKRVLTKILKKIRKINSKIGIIERRLK